MNRLYCLTGMRLFLTALIAICMVAVLSFGLRFISPAQVLPESEIVKTTPMPEISMTYDGDDQSGDQVTKTGGRYTEYSSGEFDNSTTGRRVLFFYASWCPTCRPADESLRTNQAAIPDDVTVIRVNYNDPETDREEKDLADRYAVTYQHTFVQIDGDGNEIAKWNGGQIGELVSNLRQ